MISVCKVVMRCYLIFTHLCRGHRGRDRMVIGFITTYAISAYHH